MSLIRFNKWNSISDEDLKNLSSDAASRIIEVSKKIKDDDYSELTEFVENELKGFATLLDSIRVEFEGLDKRITAIEEKYGLDEFDDEEGEDDGDEGIDE